MKTVRDDAKQFIEDGCWEWAHEEDQESAGDDVEDSQDSVFTMDKEAVDNLADETDDEGDDESED